MINEILKSKLLEIGIESTKFTILMTPEYIGKLEIIIGETLPDTYRWFLETYSQSWVFAVTYPMIEKVASQCHEETIERFHGASSRTSDDIISIYSRYINRIPDKFLAIGEDAGGNQICLGIKGEVRGKVYFWDHEGETIPGGPMPENNTYLIANSFEEFILSLKPCSMSKDF